MESIRCRRIGPKVGLVAGLLALVVGVLGPTPKAEADGPNGPDTCLWGFVWRQARSTDHVCVTPATSRATAWDNVFAPERRNPDGTCKQGFVWREAFPGDRVCVTPATRSQARADNAAGPSRRALDLYSVELPPFNPENCVHGRVALDLNPSGAYSYRGRLVNDCVWPFDYTVACVVKLLDGSGFSFAQKGSIGPDINIEKPVRKWDKHGISGQIANHWPKVGPRSVTHCRLEYTLDVGAVIDAIKKAVEITKTIIAIV